MKIHFQVDEIKHPHVTLRVSACGKWKGQTYLYCRPDVGEITCKSCKNTRAYKDKVEKK